MSAFASSRSRRGAEAPGAVAGPFANDAGVVLKFPVSISREAMRIPSEVRFIDLCENRGGAVAPALAVAQTAAATTRAMSAAKSATMIVSPTL
jgi:hypothetical protein